MQKMVTTPGYLNIKPGLRRILLGICWMLGMAAGCIYSQRFGDLSAGMIRQTALTLPTFVGSVSVALLPFLLSAFAVSICEPWLLLAISSFKAFSFSFCAWGVCLAFGKSSWLVLFLFLFSDFCLVPALYLYWLRHIHGKAAHIWENVLVVLYTSLIAILDHQIVAPFLVSVLR